MVGLGEQCPSSAVLPPPPPSRRSRPRASQPSALLNPLPRPTSASPRTPQSTLFERTGHVVSQSFEDVEDHVWEAIDAFDEIVAPRGKSQSVARSIARTDAAARDIPREGANESLTQSGARPLKKSGGGSDTDSDFVAPKQARKPQVRPVCPYSSSKVRGARANKPSNPTLRTPGANSFPMDSPPVASREMAPNFEHDRPSLVGAGNATAPVVNPLTSEPRRKPPPEIYRSSAAGLGAPPIAPLTPSHVIDYSPHCSSDPAETQPETREPPKRRRRSFLPMQWSDDEENSSGEKPGVCGPESDEDDELLLQPHFGSRATARRDSRSQLGCKRPLPRSHAPIPIKRVSGVQSSARKRVRRIAADICADGSSDDESADMRGPRNDAAVPFRESDVVRRPAFITVDDSEGDASVETSDEDVVEVERVTEARAVQSSHVPATKRAKFATPRRRRLPRSALQIDPPGRFVCPPRGVDGGNGYFQGPCAASEFQFSGSLDKNLVGGSQKATPSRPSWQKRPSAFEGGQTTRKKGVQTLLDGADNCSLLPRTSEPRFPEDSDLVVMKHRNTPQLSECGPVDSDGGDEWMNERDIGDFSDGPAPRKATRVLGRENRFDSTRVEKTKLAVRRPRRVDLDVENVVDLEEEGICDRVRKINDMHDRDEASGGSSDGDESSSDKCLADEGTFDGVRTEGDVEDLILLSDSDHYERVESRSHLRSIDAARGSSPTVLEESHQHPSDVPPPLEEAPVFNIGLVLCQPGESVTQMVERLGVDRVMDQVFDAQLSGRKVVGGEELGIFPEMMKGDSSPGKALAADKFRDCTGKSRKKYTLEDANARVSGAKERYQARFASRRGKRGGRKYRGGFKKPFRKQAR